MPAKDPHTPVMTLRCMQSPEASSVSISQQGCFWLWPPALLDRAHADGRVHANVLKYPLQLNPEHTIINTGLMFTVRAGSWRRAR